MMAATPFDDCFTRISLRMGMHAKCLLSSQGTGNSTQLWTITRKSPDTHETQSR